MPLEKYRRKRDFSRTPEPAGDAGKAASGNAYLIQKHAARALHYDLRLQLGDVLKSWAVPKGPCLDPGQKRLAKHVEDHPLEYGSFEGIIPAGEYGGGTVLLWDRGEWEAEGDPERDYRRGRLSFRLHGEKLQGGWTLARMGGKAAADGENWLLIKRDDDKAVPGDDGEFVAAHPLSVVSGRTLEQIAAASDRVWQNGEAVVLRSSAAKEDWDPARLAGARQSPQPERVAPQLAKLVEAPPAGDGWLHEIKFDGYRLVSRLDDGEVRLWSRNGLDWTERFPVLSQALARLPLRQGIFDGELVVLDPRGISDFQALQNVLRHGGEGRLVYYLFDLVHCQGYDLSRAPLAERKELLRQLLADLDPETAVLRYSDHIRGEGERVYRHACGFGLEGIVSKRADSPYAQRRSDRWLKVKCQQRQEFVIGGFTAPGGSRSRLGALLVGVHDAQGNLVYAGKVGTGFTETSLDELAAALLPRQMQHPPFHNPPRGSAARGVAWVRPELVAEIEFTEWTSDGRLRHPSFKGVREDKAATEIGRERPAPPATPRAAGGGGKVNIAGVAISNPEKILYPEQGVTKGALVEYYAAVADRILPFVAGRPLTIVRCPQGRGHKCFYQKHLNESVPAPVRGVAVKEKEGEGRYLVIDDLAGLITLVQLGALEFHPWGAREDRLERPDMVIFDLDPDPEVVWEAVIHCARRLHQRLGQLGLRSFLKTSGGKGLHVVVPLLRRAEWEEVKAFARGVAEDLAREEPGRYVTSMAKAKRQGRIFIDFFRNSRGATSVAPYSTRARPGAPVSTPLHWEELTVGTGPADYTVGNLSRRLARLGSDPWGDFFTVRQSITKAMRQELGLER